jgi:hypothetical protein
MKIIIFGIILAININSEAQTSFIMGRQYGTTEAEYARNHVADRNGNLYVSGNTKGIMDDKNFGNYDGYITKLDSTGNTIWTKQFGSDGIEDIQWSAIDNKGNIFVTGTTTGSLGDSNFGQTDFFLVKFSSEGKKIWTKQFGSDSTDIATGIFADYKGYIYLTGSTLGVLGKSTSGDQDAFMMKLDSTGIPVYTIQFGTTSRDGCSAITGDNFGNLYVCGSTFGNIGSTNNGFMDGFVGQFTEDGILTKCTQFGSEGFEIPTSILSDNEKNIYVGGSTSGNFASEQKGEGDCFLVKLNLRGDLLWKDQFGTNKHDGIKGLAFNAEISDNILVSGILNLPPAHAFIRMYKKDGSFLWEKSLIAEGDNRDASGKDISIDNKGYIYHLGLTSSSLYGNLIGVDDFYLVKLKLDNTH